MTDLSFLNQLSHHFGNDFGFDLRVDTMLEVQVDGFCLKTFQRTFYRLMDLFRTSVRNDVAVRVFGKRNSELGRNDHFVTERLQSFSEQFFINIRAVDFCSVDFESCEMRDMTG